MPSYQYVCVECKEEVTLTLTMDERDKPVGAQHFNFSDGECLGEMKRKFGAYSVIGFLNGNF